jgi:hypothetical protein
VRGCKTGFLELKASYTSNPKEAIDKCYTYFPILYNARTVLEQKQAVLDGKTPIDQEQGVPWEL